MSIPEHLWRFPTRAAIDSLARRFGFPNTPSMQDWEWEVADPERIEEFLAAYSSGELSDDERFTLMETIIQSFEESDRDFETDAQWSEVLNTLDEHIELHAYTVWYWSYLDDEDPANWFWVTPWIRKVLEKHRSRLEQPPRSA